MDRWYQAGFRLTILLMLACALFMHTAIGYAKGTSNPTAELPPVTQKLKHLVTHCYISDWDGTVRFGISGTACLFFADGSLLRSTNGQLIFYDSNFVPVWKKDFHGHHQLNLSEDGERILVLSDSIRRIKGKNYRFDRLLILNKSGETISELDFAKLRPWFDRVGLLPGQKRVTFRVKSDYLSEFFPLKEFSHANSFYEIPANRNESRHPAFAQGNFIVNDNLNCLVFILDKNLKRILWHARHIDLTSGLAGLHDVQVLASGKIFHYANRSIDSDFELRETGNSSIDLYDPISRKNEQLYTGTKANPFFSNVKGGMQLLGEHYLLLSDITGNQNRILLIDNESKKIIHSLSGDNLGDQLIQQVKAEDLSDFLKSQNGAGI